MNYRIVFHLARQNESEMMIFHGWSDLFRDKNRIFWVVKFNEANFHRWINDPRFFAPRSFLTLKKNYTPVSIMILFHFFNRFIMDIHVIRSFYAMFLFLPFLKIHFFSFWTSCREIFFDKLSINYKFCHLIRNKNLTKRIFCIM